LAGETKAKQSVLMWTARENHHVQDLEWVPDFSLTEGTELAGQPL
jgi:hypothetical protein